MTASDPRVWVAEARARAEVATGGPWQSVADDTPAPLQHGWGVMAEGVTEMPIVAIDWGVVTAPDAAFIAAARTDLSRALDALQAVLDRHQPTSTVLLACEDYDGCDGTANRTCDADDADEHEVPSCGECRAYAAEYDSAAEYVFPCPTVRAITASLEVAP